MLRRLRELNPALIRRLAHRLFFAVNKIDMVGGRGWARSERMNHEGMRCIAHMQHTSWALACVSAPIQPPPSCLVCLSVQP